MTKHLRHELDRSRVQNEHYLRENFNRMEEIVYRTERNQLELPTTIQVVNDLRNMVEDQKR